MANGTFDYKNDPRFAKLRHGAKYGMYDQAALTSALNAPDLKGSAGYDFGQAFSEIGDAYNPQGSWQDYTSGLLGAMKSDPNARDPGFGGMSYSQFQSLFPDQAKAFGRSQEFKDFQSGVGQNTAQPSGGNPAAVSAPSNVQPDPPPPPPPPPPSSPPPVDPGMRDYYNQRMEAARALARAGRTDFDLSEAAEAARRIGMPSDIDDLRRNVMKSFVAPAGATTGPAAQPQVDVSREHMGVVSQAAGPSAAAAQAVGGVTDKELRQQQMDTQRELIQGAEDFAARTRQGLPGVKVADPNLNIRIEEAAAPTGGPSIGVRGLGRPELLATGDVQYDPEYFKYETDLQQVMLDSLRQNLLGPGGMDPVAASQMADARARQAKDEAQTVEDLQRYGVLRGGGDTADVLGELRSGYGRTYSDILADQALRRQDDPSLEAAMRLAQLGSDRYMRGGEMIGRLGGQDTLAARQAQQDALERQSAMDLEAQIEQQRATEREANISGFLRGARSLAGRDQDIGAQMDRADRQLEQARVLAPQYQYAADLQRRDAMMQQDLADRALARGMTITEPTTRERFEEGVRSAQEAEALARADVTGYLDGQSTLARETGLDLERERMQQEARNLSQELANRVRLGILDAEKAIEVQRAINTGNIDLAKAQLEGEAGMQTERVQAEKEMQTERVTSEQEMQTERVRAESRNLQNQLANTLKMGILDAEKAVAIQNLINSGNLELAEKELEGVTATLTSEEKRQTERVGQEEKQSQRDYALAKDELLNRLTMANIDLDKATRIQNLINSGNLALAEKELEGVTATLASEEKRQTERVTASSADLAAQLENNIAMGNIDKDKAAEIQGLINSGNLELATKELEGITATLASEEKRQTERVKAQTTDLMNQLANNIQMGILDAEKAIAIQDLINTGNLELAEKELEGITATLTSEEKRQTEQVQADKEMQTERVQAQTRDLMNQLANNIQMGILDAEKAIAIQDLINTGNLDLAKEELQSAERMQTERVTASSADLAAQLENNIAMGNIDKDKATEIQSLINSGNLDLAREELASAERMQTERVTSEEAMQTERIQSQEGQFNSELEFRKAIETGQIDGMPTLQAQLQRAQLADMLTARQAESLGQLLALANAMEGDARARTMAAIAKPIQQLMASGGRGYTEVKQAVSSILNVDPNDYGG